jgi:dTDP-4-amino-4,6-dideoxygalactose transaminase
LLGYNNRLDEIQAAILRVKLKKIDEWNRQRILAAQTYNVALGEIKEVVIPPSKEGSVYYLYPILAKKRDQLQQFLAKNGIQTLIHYPIPIHKQQAVQVINYKKANLENTEKYAKRLLSLPIFPGITKTEIFKVAEIIKKFYRKNA